MAQKINLEELTTEELKVIALLKDKKGNATKEAFEAQMIIYDRADCPIRKSHFNPYTHKKCTTEYSY